MLMGSVEDSTIWIGCKYRKFAVDACFKKLVTQNIAVESQCPWKMIWEATDLQSWPALYRLLTIDTCLTQDNLQEKSSYVV